MPRTGWETLACQSVLPSAASAVSATPVLRTVQRNPTLPDPAGSSGTNVVLDTCSRLAPAAETAAWTPRAGPAADGRREARCKPLKEAKSAKTNSCRGSRDGR